MKKPSLPMVLASATLLAATVASGHDDIVLKRDKLHNQAVQESLLPACSGVPGKVPFWNAHASRFMFAPAFDFKEVENAVDYRFVLKPEKGGGNLSFHAAHSWCALSPAWEKTPVGYVDLEVEALDSSQQVIGIAGRRRFYRAAVFNGPYHPEPVMSYADSARKALEYLYSSSWLQHWLTDGTPDPTYSHYCYPSKMVSAVVNGMLRYGEMVPEDKENAWKIARIAADHLIAASEPDGTPLAHFPPTYDGDFIKDDIDYGHNVDHARKSSRKKAGQIMLIYPARAGLAYLNLYRHTQDKKHYEAARKIADTYLRLQDDQGYWPLVMDARTGKRTVSNHANSCEIRALLECFAKDYGIDEYKPAIRKAEALWIHEIDHFNFEAQFEDNSKPGRENKNLAGIPAQDAVRYFFGKARDAEDQALRNSLMEKAEDYLRFAEDQFVVWSDPIPQPRPNTKRDSSDWVFFPCALEQYNCYRPIDIHAAFFVSAFADAWKTTGKEIYLAKAISLANSLTRAQDKDGRYPTWWKSSEYTDPGWLNCAVGSALAMQEFGEKLPKWNVE